LNPKVIDIYTDGSCHQNLKIGAWASILIIGNEKIVLKDFAQDTTHNRMELLAVIKSIEFVDKQFGNVPLSVYTDSQYVTRIQERKEKLKMNHFITKKGTTLQNSDLVQILINQIETHTIKFIKVKAHQKLKEGHSNIPEIYNSEVDKIARQMVRDIVKSSNLETTFVTI